MSFAKKIIGWYDENARVLPWRQTDNPYYIWLSEIILQQTRIEQGREYYDHFVTHYPTVRSLAAASEEKVLKSWQGLGYYSRARNLHKAAQYIVDELGGEFPNTYEGILRLKGVGRYTAAAISSFAFRLPYPVIDGNVYRLISRLYGIYTPIGTDAAYREFEGVLNRLIDRGRPDVFNQALMDFGSVYCKPVGCDCANCIFCEECFAYKNGKVDVLPVKSASAAVKTRYFYYFDLVYNSPDGQYTFLQQRSGEDIWKGLYEFPLVETEEAFSGVSLARQVKMFMEEHVGSKYKVESISAPVSHKLTHRNIVAVFVRANFSEMVRPIAAPILKIPCSEIKKYPVSRLIDKYLSRK